MKTYRILERKRANKEVEFAIQYQCEHTHDWLLLTSRETLDFAILAVKQLKERDIIEERVVWSD